MNSPCECEYDNPDYFLDARLFRFVVLAVAPAVTMDEASSLLILESWSWGLVLGQRVGELQGCQSINQILKAPHEHKRSHIPAHPHGQQTPRREASQAWGSKSESRKR